MSKERHIMDISPPTVQCIHAIVETEVLPQERIERIQARSVSIELTERQLAWIQNEAKDVMKYSPRVGQVFNVILDVEMEYYDEPNKTIGITFLCTYSSVLMMCAEKLPSNCPGDIHEICGEKRLRHVSNREWHYDLHTPLPTLILQV
jgi:hypothetical protein